MEGRRKGNGCAFTVLLLLQIALASSAQAQDIDVQRHSWEGGADQSHAAHAGPTQDGEPAVDLQPLAQQVRRPEAALDFLGQPLQVRTQQAFHAAVSRDDERAAVEAIQ